MAMLARMLFFHSARFAEQFTNVYAECAGDARDVAERRIPQTKFNASEVGSVDSGVFS